MLWPIKGLIFDLCSFSLYAISMFSVYLFNAGATFDRANLHVVALKAINRSFVVSSVLSLGSAGNRLC